MALKGCRFLILTFLILLGSNVGAVGRSSGPIENPEVRIAALQAEVAVMQDFKDSILQTAYWSLGVNAVVLLAMFGMNWWQNFKVYDRDKQAMRTELDAAIKSEIGAAKVALEGTLSARADELSDHTKEVLKRMEDRVALLDKKVREEMGRVEEQFTKRLRTMRVLMQLGDFEAHLTRRTASTDFFAFMLTMQHEIRQIDPNTAHTVILSVLGHVETMDEMYSDVRTAVLEFCANCPEEFAVKVDEIRRNLQRIRTI